MPIYPASSLLIPLQPSDRTSDSTFQIDFRYPLSDWSLVEPVGRNIKAAFGQILDLNRKA
jgi:hypothetical protein